MEQAFRHYCVDPFVFDRWGYTKARSLLDSSFFLRTSYINRMKRPATLNPGSPALHTSNNQFVVVFFRKSENVIKVEQAEELGNTKVNEDVKREKEKVRNCTEAHETEKSVLVKVKTFLKMFNSYSFMKECYLFCTINSAAGILFSVLAFIQWKG